MSALDLLLSAQRPFLNDGGIETELIFLDNLERYTSGQPLCNVVDKELMY